MALSQRFLPWAILPVAVLVTVHLYSPMNTSWEWFNTLFFGTLPPRSQTPIVVSAFTHWSHFEKVAKLAVVLAELGYPVIFITGRIFEKDVLGLHPHITFHPLLGEDSKTSTEDFSTYASQTPGLERELLITKVTVIESMKPTHDTLQQVFRDFRDEHGVNKPLISLFDTPIIGHHPILLGAPGIKPDSSIVINCHPLMMNSNDSFPFYAGKAPHTGPDAKAVHGQAILDQRHDHYTFTLSTWYWEALKELGVQTDLYLMDAMHTLPDHMLSLGVPEFEFPRSDLRSNVHYMGAMKKLKKSGQSEIKHSNLPNWWYDVKEAKQQRKKIVAVSQGTIETDLNNLLLPTLEALRHRDDILLIATTVTVEPADVPGLIVPPNARVEKFVPYDMLLPLVDVLVNNGGYGAVIQALEHGVPLVVGGEGQDKNVTNAIIQWSGVGIHIGGRSPGIEKIREGVEKILGDNSYMQRATAMRKRFEKYDVGRVVDAVIQGVIRDWAAKRRA